MPAAQLRFRKVLTVALVYAGLALAIVIAFCPHCLQNWDNLSGSWLYSFVLSVVLGEGNGYLIRETDKRLSWVEAPVKRLLLGLVLVLVYSFVASLLCVVVFDWFVFKNARTWESVFSHAVFPVIISIVLVVVMTSRSFLFSWRQAAIDAEKLKRENLQAQYNQLRSQVNPHFLFNSLNVLTDLVYVDADLAARFIQQLSQVFRYALESNTQELVPLQKELEVLRAYLFLLQIRFGENLQVTLPEVVPANAQIVPFSLQLLVENAVKHNIVTSEDPLKIAVSLAANRIEVRNNLQRKNQTEPSTGIGLANIKARYQHLNAGEVLVQETKGEFVVSVPVLNYEL